MSDAHAAPSADAPHAENAEHSGHAAHGPQIPEVVDEAGNSPSWLPWLGLGLFCLAALVFAGQSALSKRAAAAVTTEEPTGAEQAGVEVQEPADKPAEQPAPGDGH